MEFLWERFKGALGFGNRTNSQLVERKIIEFLKEGRIWINEKNVNMVDALAQRVGLMINDNHLSNNDPSTLQHPELNTLINDIHATVFNQPTKKQVYLIMLSNPIMRVLIKRVLMLPQGELLKSQKLLIKQSKPHKKKLLVKSIPIKSKRKLEIMRKREMRTYPITARQLQSRVMAIFQTKNLLHKQWVLQIQLL